MWWWWVMRCAAWPPRSWVLPLPSQNQVPVLSLARNLSEWVGGCVWRCDMEMWTVEWMFRCDVWRWNGRCRPAASQSQPPDCCSQSFLDLPVNLELQRLLFKTSNLEPQDLRLGIRYSSYSTWIYWFLWWSALGQGSDDQWENIGARAIMRNF